MHTLQKDPHRDPKIKTTKHIENWKKKYKAPYLFSAKLDGISAMFVNNTHLYTQVHTNKINTHK